MAKFYSSELYLDTNQTVSLGATQQRTMKYDGTNLSIAGGTVKIEAGTLTLPAGGAVNEFSIDGTLAGNSDSAVPTEKAVKTYVDNVVAGLDWQESVLDIAVATAVPPTEVAGDRYLLDASGPTHANWDGAADGDIVQFNGTLWVVTYDASTEQGGAAYVEDVDVMYTHVAGSVNWVQFAAGIDHGALTGLGDDDHSQYPLLLGRAGGQTLIGGTAAGNDLTFQTTSNGTKGTYIFSENSLLGAAYFTAAGELSVEAQLNVARGGTGVNGSAATDGQILIGNDGANNFTLAAITGTANKVTVTNGAGSITLTLPNAVYLGAAATAGTLRIYNSNAGTGYITMAVDAAAATNVTYTWPTAVTASRYLQTDGSGNLSWATVAGTVPDGTIASSILRWSGAAWVEETDLRVDATGNATFINRAAVRLQDANNGFYTGFQAPATLTANVTLILPDGDATVAGQSLVSNAAGTLSWATRALVTLANLAGTAVNADIIPDSNNDTDLGSAALGWAEGYINKLFLDSNGQTTTIAGSGSATASVNYILPTADGTAGQFLSTNASGVLSWGTPAGSGTVNSGVAGNLALYPATATAVDDMYVQNANNINIAIAAHAALGAPRTYTIVESGASCDFVMTAGNQSIGGTKTFSATTLFSTDVHLEGVVIAGTSHIQVTNVAGALQQTYNFTANNILTDDDAVYAALNKLDGALGADGSKSKFGKADIGNASTTVAIVFTTAYADANFRVSGSLVNTVDGTPSIYPWIVTAKATTGFTVTLSGATDSANYDFEWHTDHA